jgi:two-component system sensor kinase FixL
VEQIYGVFVAMSHDACSTSACSDTMPGEVGPSKVDRARVLACLLELLREHGVMTMFSAAAVAVLIVLLIFFQLRRMQTSGQAAGFPVDVELSRQRYTNYAFAAADEAADRVRTAEALQDQTSIRRSAGFRPPRLSGRHIVDTHLAMLSRGRFRRTSPENELQPCHVKSRTEPADGSRSAARQSRHDERFGGTLDLLPLTILVANPQGKTLFANAAAEKLFGYSREELIGVAVRELIPALQLNVSGADSACAELTIGGREPDGHRDLVARRRDGTEFPAEVAINPVSWESETCTLTIVIDRTERYELLRNRQQLAHLTRVSTLGELAGSLAHELNQPLTAILSNAQAAQRFLATEPVNLGEVREILHDLVDDTHRASEVIRKIRALVKKGDLEAAPLSVASVIRDVALLVHSDAIVRGIHMRVTVTPELPPVDGDKVQYSTHSTHWSPARRSIVRSLLRSPLKGATPYVWRYEIAAPVSPATRSTNCSYRFSPPSETDLALDFQLAGLSSICMGDASGRKTMRITGPPFISHCPLERGQSEAFKGGSHERGAVDGLRGGRRCRGMSRVDAADTLRWLLR